MIRAAICDDEIGTCSEIENMILNYARLQALQSEQERELFEQEIRMYENQFEIIRQSQIAARSLKHDMKHHLKMLYDLVSSGNNNAALKYLSDMGAFMDNMEEFVSSGNERIDSILNYMIGKAQNANIHISWKIQIPEQIEISTFDINVILSNLLDNALNALEDIPNPTLEILMKYDRGLLCISIQNNCSHEQAAIFHAHSVSQPDNEHGYGLKNVQRIVEKYHGSLTTECVNDVFHASILLFLSNMEKTNRTLYQTISKSVTSAWGRRTFNFFRLNVQFFQSAAIPF